MPDLNGIFKYYFYLDDDREQMENLIHSLKAKGVDYVLPSDIDKEIAGESARKLCYELVQGKTRILVVQMLGEGISWDYCLKMLESAEDCDWPGCEQMLGQTAVLMSTTLPWDGILDYTRALSNRKLQHVMEMKSGQMARFITDSHHVYYACGLDDYNRNFSRLLGSNLPLIEAQWLETHMISNLLRDSISMIVQERAELDKKLSHILHSHLVNDPGSIKQAEELEEQIQELSSSYGIIAGNNSVASEGHRRLEGLLTGLIRQLKAEPALNISTDSIDNITGIYSNRLEELSDLMDMLKTTRESHQAAINVVRSRIDIMNSRNNMATQEKIRDLMELNTSIQKQSLVFQFAAGLIEFIILAYYSHSLWKNIAHDAYLAVPGIIQLIVVFLFSGTTTYLTHLLAEYLHGERHLKSKIILTFIPLLIILSIIISGSIILTTSGH